MTADQGRACRRAAAALLATATPLPVLAQTPPVAGAAASVLPVITVTAQRRSEGQQDVPIAVTALDADTLTARAVQTPLAAAQFVPNMFAVHNIGLGSANSYFLRGLGSVETIATFDPAVGTYVDDIYVGRQNANDFGFFDVERVEVLRGPQGTLFGRNTTGGVINVALRGPGDRVGGYGEFAAGAYGRRLVRGSLDLPMSEIVRFKLSGYLQNDTGWLQNTTTGERLNDSNMAGLRGAVEFRFAPTVRWQLSASYMRNDAELLPSFGCDPNSPTDCWGRFAATGLKEDVSLVTGAFAGTVDPLTGQNLAVSGRKAGFGLGNRSETQLYASTLSLGGEALSLQLITGYLKTAQRYALDLADGRPLPSLANPAPAPAGWSRGGYTLLNDGETSQFTQEAKAAGRLLDGRISWVAGAFYLSESSTTDFADIIGPDALLADRLLRNDTSSLAGYGQIDVRPLPALTLTAGIRYTDEDKRIGLTDNRAFCVGGGARCLDTAALAAAGIPLDQRVKLWTPRLAASWKLDDATLVYASATRGFKSGGWNARAFSAAALLPFSPERVWSYEAGVRAEFLDRRLRVNLTGFWLEADDLQTPAAQVDPVTGAIGFATQNYAGYRNRGLELELAAVSVEGLNLYANIGWQNDRYVPAGSGAPRFGVVGVEAQQAACRAQLAAGRVPLARGADNAVSCAQGIVDANGNLATPVRTPDFTVAAGAGWDYPVPPAGIILTPRVDLQYRSRLETGTANATLFTGTVRGASGTLYPANPFAGNIITGSATPAVVLVSAALQLRTDDGNWLLSLECENCLDKAWSQNSLFNVAYLAPPRLWQFRMKRVF